MIDKVGGRPKEAIISGIEINVDDLEHWLQRSLDDCAIKQNGLQTTQSLKPASNAQIDEALRSISDQPPFHPNIIELAKIVQRNLTSLGLKASQLQIRRRAAKFSWKRRPAGLRKGFKSRVD